MHEARPRLGQPVTLTLRQVNGVAVNRTFAQQALRLVSVQIVTGLGEQLPHPGDLVRLFGQMRLHQAIGMLAPQRPQRRQLFGGRGGGKPGCDHIRQPVAPMPFF